MNEKSDPCEHCECKRERCRKYPCREKLHWRVRIFLREIKSDYQGKYSTDEEAYKAFAKDYLNRNKNKLLS